jgi:hypothetical protein
MHLSAMNIDELNPSIDNTHELNKDAMLEKIILISVSYFCIGTELRFLSLNDEERPGDNDSNINIEMKEEGGKGIKK